MIRIGHARGAFIGFQRRIQGFIFGNCNPHARGGAARLGHAVGQAELLLRLHLAQRHLARAGRCVDEFLARRDHADGRPGRDGHLLAAGRAQQAEVRRSEAVARVVEVLARGDVLADGRDVLAADLEHVVRSALVGDVARGVHADHVARRVPGSLKGLTGLDGITLNGVRNLSEAMEIIF